MEISKTKKMVLAAMLLALTIVLARFLSINTSLLSIGFSFVPIMLSAIWLGPKYSTIIATLADIIGALLFPFGTFFIGFTISAFVKGLIYGVVLYKKDAELSNKELLIRLIIATVVNTIIVNIFMNAVWLVIMYDKAFLAVLSARIIPQIVLIPIEIITIFVLVKVLRPITNKYLYD